MITFNGKIDTEAEEKLVFEAFKQFMAEQFQNYSFEISGKNETFKDENERKE